VMVKPRLSSWNTARSCRRGKRVTLIYILPVKGQSPQSLNVAKIGLARQSTIRRSTSDS
jgi:hypothetical protein